MAAPISPFVNSSAVTPPRQNPLTLPDRARVNPRDANPGANTESNPGQDRAETARDQAVEIRLSAQAQNAVQNTPPSPPPAASSALPLGLAEVQLREVMAQLGIPSSAVVRIRAAADGGFSVDSDAARAAELEAMLNNGTARELRNALSRAQRDASPSNAAPRPSRATGAAAYGAPGGPPVSDVEFTFDGSQLSGQRLAPNGQRIGVNIIS
jgi:hypothetical protein